jgi:YD repeat-containing protein
MTSESRYGVNTSFTYDGSGNVTSRTDARGQTTSYSNYYRGIPQTERRPAGVAISRTVNSAGDVTSESDGAGNTHSYAYDGIRRLTAWRPPSGSSMSISWGSASRSASRGAYTESASFDGLGNPTSVTRGGISTDFSFNALRYKTYESLPGSGSGTTFGRDMLGRVTSVRNADGSSRSYTYSGNSVSVTDERGHTTTYRFAAFGDPDQRTEYVNDLETPWLRN